MTDLEQCVAIENAVEALIDAHGLYAITQALEIVCHSKANHLASNWQDDAAAKRWERAARVFDRTHAALRKIQMD